VTALFRYALAGLMTEAICNGRRNTKRRCKIGESESKVSGADFKISRWAATGLLVCMSGFGHLQPVDYFLHSRHSI
jgi:hypothetical protein